MASKPGPLYKFPWEDMGSFKYLLLAPFAVAAATGNDDQDNWCWHMCAIVALRYIMAQFFLTVSRFHAFTKHTRIQDKGIQFAQIDREDHWDDYILLQVYVATAVHHLPYLGYSGFPLLNVAGLKQMLLWHVGPAEFVYYWLHRALHHHYLYSRYHSHHHACKYFEVTLLVLRNGVEISSYTLFPFFLTAFVTEPITGSVHPFMEHLMYTAVFAIPLLGPFFQGGASIAMFYSYMIGFDTLNMIGHCNFEFVPRFIMAIPGFKYLLYTPSYHSLHHSRIHCNFCLFMPIYDAMFGTVNWKVTDKLYDLASQGKAVPMGPPDVVFVGHGTTLTSAFHAPFALRSFSSRPFVDHWYLKLAWPLCFVAAIFIRLFGKPYTHDRHKLRHLVLETWVTPAFAIHFFLPSQWPWINDKIQSAIQSAADSGVKVIGLGALNKNEALNGGGKLFVEKMGDSLKNTRVVHGNTLTAAAVLQKIPADAGIVFVTGATSKLGRAISLYLAEMRGVKVVMYTKSKERFEAIREEASEHVRPLLVHASKLEAGSQIQDWIVGKFCSPKDQLLAPPNATFHQFVVPPLVESRKDCTYTALPAFRMPPDTRDFKTCEMTMERNCVHACHAGAVVHALEGWDYHEVGAIDYTRIDATWEASVKHGFVLQ